MSYATLLAAAWGKRPFMLVAFRRGANEYLYCDRSKPMTKAVAGITGTSWAASSIRPGRIGDSARATRSEVKITLPITDAFARSMLGGVGFQPVSVTIWRGFANDPDGEVIVAFRGLVLAVAPDDRAGIIEMTCMTDQAALERKGLAAVMQRPCRHSVYGPGCGLTLADWQDELTVLAIDESAMAVQVDLAGSGAPASGYYRGGILSYAGRLLWVVDHTDDWLTLEAASPELLAAVEALGTGDPYPTVLVAPGCDLTTATCSARFDNLDNFGGFPEMADTPFDGRSIV